MTQHWLHDLLSWTARACLTEEANATVFDRVCQRLAAAGVGIDRAVAASATLDIDVGGTAHIWTAATGTVIADSFSRAELHEEPEVWRTAPWWRMDQDKLEELRVHFDDVATVASYPLLQEMKEGGSTDYLAQIVHFAETQAVGEMDRAYFSWSTRRPEGFAAWELDSFRSLAPVLALAIKARATDQIARRLMDIYIGPDAGRRVFAGEIERGRAEELEAVIWLSDLKGFTAAADRMPATEVMGLLNAYMEPQVEAIDARGGQVLKFLGDGILAIFPDTGEAGCRAALDATEATLAALDGLTAERQAGGAPTSDLVIALGRGTVQYGNIGSKDRLDFTVIGPAVNEAARLEALAGGLGQRVVISQAFAEAAGAERRRLVSLGRYALRGFARPRELFTLDPEAT